MNLTSGLHLNPKLAAVTQAELRALYEKYRHEFSPDCLWLATSGTTTAQAGSLVVLSPEALAVSAEAVNRHLHVTDQDRWGLVLPLFHIGGVMILVRAALNGAGVFRYDDSWNARTCHRWLGDARVTILSVVPTQVFDFVALGLRAPQSLRAVIVGGGKLDPLLFKKGRDLGWPLLLSYGMTECSSQIATGSTEEPDVLRPLPHVAVRDVDGIIEVRSRALLAAKFELSGSVARFSPDQWYRTSDRGQVVDVNGRPALQIHGRAGDVVKILGELVDVARLTSLLHQCIPFDRRLELTQKLKITADHDLRIGARLILNFQKDADLKARDLEEILKHYNASVAPFERVLDRREVELLPEATWKDGPIKAL